MVVTARILSGLPSSFELLLIVFLTGVTRREISLQDRMNSVTTDHPNAKPDRVGHKTVLVTGGAG